MKKVLKWFGIVLGVLLLVIAIVLAVFYFKGSAMLNNRVSAASETIAIPTDAASLARGKHFVQAICADCHSDALSGKIMVEAPFATIYSANLTPGKGGAGAEFKDADWVRALRHGADNQGRSLLIMPSQLFWNFTDQDLGDIIAYLKTLPPVDNQQPDPKISALGKVMFGSGLFGPEIVPANVIAHDQRPPAVAIGVTAAYGEYLVSVTGCRDCHGAQLAGGKSDQPGALDASNLTPAGDLKAWSGTQFINTIRTGVTPGGRVLNPDEMPWKHITNYSDDELNAIFLYLQSQPPLPTVKP